MTSRALVVAVSVAAIGLAGAAGCSGILGIQDRSLDPGTGDGATADGSMMADVRSDGPSPEMGPGDGGSDTAVETGPCGDTTSNMHNCGRCGHDCLGGACEAGACQPVAIVTTVPGITGVRPTQLALTDTAVYFTDSVNAAVGMVNKDGTNPQLLYNGGFHDNALAVDDGGVYFSDLSVDAVVHCTLTSCGAAPALLAVVPSGGDINSIALDQGITFTDDMCDLYRLPTRQAGTPATLVLSDGGSACPLEVKTDGTYLYVGYDTGQVTRMGFDGGGALNLSGALQVPFAAGIAIDSQAIYWVQADPNLTLPGTVNIAGLDGSNAHVIASGQPNPVDVASDGTNIYWVNIGFGTSGNSGTVLTCAPGNCQQPVTLASQQPDPAYIAVDSNAVYWTNYAGINNFPGTVMKVAKP